MDEGREAGRKQHLYELIKLKASESSLQEAEHVKYSYLLSYYPMSSSHLSLWSKNKHSFSDSF